MHSDCTGLTVCRSSSRPRDILHNITLALCPVYRVQDAAECVDLRDSGSKVPTFLDLELAEPARKRGV